MLHDRASRIWAWVVLGGYLATTLLSWLPIAPGPTRTMIRIGAVAWISLASLAWMVALGRESVTPDVWKFVKRIVVAVGICGVLAVPMLTRDIWSYAAFARLTSGGANPYVTTLPETLQVEFRVPSFGDTMAYGPVWAYGLAAFDRAIAPLGLNVEIAALKGVLVAAWIGVVGGFAWLQRRQSLQSRAVGLVAIAVAPISAFELIAEAHNDVVVMALAVWWLALRSKGSWLSPIPLAVSVLIKYITAPLLVFAAIDAWRRRRYQESACALLAGVAILIVGGLLWQDGALVASAATNYAKWRWLSAPFVIELIVKNLASFDWVGPIVWMWRALLALGFAWYLRAWWRSRDSDLAGYRVLAAGMLVTLLSADYLWPWYLIWALPFVILAQDRFLWAVAWPVFAVLPVAHAGWAGGQRGLGYRTEFILPLLFSIVLVWIAQAWLARRRRAA